MENGVVRVGRPSGDEQLTLSGGRLFLPPALSRRQQTAPFKKIGRSLTRRRGERGLYIAVVLLVVFVCLSAGLLVLRVRAETEVIKKWSYQAGIGVASSPIVANGIVYTLYDKDNLDNHVIYALDARSGREKWSYQLQGFIPSSPTLTLANNVVYVVSDDLFAEESTMYALDAATGHQKWAYRETNSAFLSSPPTVANGTVYVASSDGTLYALDTATGHQKWF